MLGARQDRPHRRSLVAVAAVALLLLAGAVAIAMTQRPSTFSASNAAAECVTAPVGPTARGYGETGAAVAGVECSSSQRPRQPRGDAPPVSQPGQKPRGRKDRGKGNGSAAGEPCPPGERLPQQRGGPNAREDDETGSGGDTAAAACVPCPSDSRAPGASDPGGSDSDSGSSSSTRDDDAVGPTGRGYGESGASGVMVPETSGNACPPEEADEDDNERTAAPTTGGGGAHDGRVPGATGRAAPARTTASESAGESPLRDPLVAASVAQAGDDGGRKNTALVVGGLVLLLVAVAVVLRRGRPGSAR